MTTTRPLPTSAPSTPRTVAAAYWKPSPGDEGGHDSKGAAGDEPKTLEVRASPLIAARSAAYQKPSSMPNDQDIIRTYMPRAPIDEGKKEVDPSCKRNGKGTGSESAGGCSSRTDPASANPTIHPPGGTAGMRSTLPNGVRKNTERKICSRDQCVRLTNSDHLYVTSASPHYAHVAATTYSAESETRPAAAAPASSTGRTAVVRGPTTTTTRARWRDSIAGGCRRQLAVATHYLNRSVFPPTRPKPPVKPRPATAAAEATTSPRRGFSAVNEERVHDRPRTAGPPPANRRPCTRDGNTWHSIPGDGRERAAAQAARLLSASPTGIGRPSNGSFAPVPRRPPSRESTESPRRGRAPAPARVGRRKTPPFGLEPGGRKKFSPKDLPACLPRQPCPTRDVEDAEWGWEVGYTISSQCRGPPEDRGLDAERGGAVPTAVSSLLTPTSESLTLSPPSEVQEKKLRPAAISPVPSIPMDRVVVHDVQSLLPSPCYDQHSKTTEQQQQQRCGGIRCPSRPRSAPQLREPSLHVAACSIEGGARLQEGNHQVSLSIEQTFASSRRPRSQSYDASTDGGICGVPPGSPSDKSRAPRQRPHSARARCRRFEDATDHPRQDPSKEGDGSFTRGIHTASKDAATPSSGGSPVKRDHAGRTGARDKDEDLKDETASPASISSSLDALVGRNDGDRLVSHVGEADSSTTPEARNHTPARGFRGDEGNVTPRERGVGRNGVVGTARGKKWTMPTRDEIVLWGRDIDRLLKFRTTKMEGETMMAVNGREQFMFSGGEKEL